MKQILLVDGYNMIHSWPEFTAYLSISLEAARVRLIDRLADFQGFAGYPIECVFDGQGTYLREHSETTGGLTIVYTRRGETADAYIERRVYELTDHYRYRRLAIRVATNDAMEQHLVLGMGATRLTIKELQGEMAEARHNGQGAVSKARPVKGHALEERLDAATLTKLERLRRGLTHGGKE